MREARSHTQTDSGIQCGMERACGFDRGELYSDEGPPIGDVAVGLWAELAAETVLWLLSWN